MKIGLSKEELKVLLSELGENGKPFDIDQCANAIAAAIEANNNKILTDIQAIISSQK
jgi:acetylglutamate kinase